jgi:hypothetical protein
MARRGLAFMRAPEELDLEVLFEASRRSIVSVGAPPIKLAA